MATLHLKISEPSLMGLDPMIPRDAWLRRFTDCLMLLEARTIAMSAARHVAASFPKAFEQDPEAVAAKFVFEELPAYEDASDGRVISDY